MSEEEKMEYKNNENETIELMKWKKLEDQKGQLVVWPSCLVEADDEERVYDFFKKNFGIKPIIVGCVLTLPDPEHRDMEEPPSGGRCDFFFFVDFDDVGKIAIKRFQFSMRWWEDVFYNEQEDIYPQEFRDAYPSTW